MRVPIPAVKLFAALMVLASPLAAQTTFTFTGAEGTTASRLSRDGVVSDASLPPKAFPGTIAGGPFLFTTFTFVNLTGGAAPFVLDMISGSGALVFLSAYLGSFNPLDLAQNYLGDAGISCSACTGGQGDFSVMSPASSTIVVMAGRTVSGTAPGGTFSFVANFATVPEPSTYALMAAGLMALAVATRRRRTA